MAITENAKAYCEKLFGCKSSDIYETDPEFAELFADFAFDETADSSLDEKTAHMAILAALIGCQGTDMFRIMLPAAMNMGVTAVEIKEIVYQSTAYLGIGRVLPFLSIANEVFREKGIALPLPPQGTVTMEKRRENGTKPQVYKFG